MKLIIFTFVMLLSVTSFAKNDVLELYNQITSKCSAGKSNFPEELLKLNEKMKAHAKSDLKNKKIETLFLDESLFSDIYSYLGTDLLNDNSDLRGLIACGKHYTKFLQQYKAKKLDESDASFGEWESCLESDYNGDIPEIARKVITCYNTRSPSNVKGSSKSAPKK